jgi:hypothetical protein
MSLVVSAGSSTTPVASHTPSLGAQPVYQAHVIQYVGLAALPVRRFS